MIVNSERKALYVILNSLMHKISSPPLQLRPNVPDLDVF